ncbi:FAD-dependent oxidoreductase, partial [Thermococcus sp.]|uniref:FAD-dependent oxidoreductase n=1 Tax=Thermococcus sp. TaxID=35749 RepID=UPI0026327670
MVSGNRKAYDVVIIGAGPAGLFAAYELSEKSDFKILVIEEGGDVDQRTCPMYELGYCIGCQPCHIMSGVG